MTTQLQKITALAKERGYRTVNLYRTTLFLESGKHISWYRLFFDGAVVTNGDTRKECLQRAGELLNK